MRFFILIILFLCSICNAKNSGDYYYYRISRDGNFIIISPKTNGFGVKDVISDAEFCNADSNFHCFSSGVMKFAVPQGNIEVKEWEYNEELYKIVNYYHINHGYDLWIIEKTTNYKMWFVWSSYYGLTMLGEGDADNQVGGVYILDGFCGFGASGVCEFN